MVVGDLLLPKTAKLKLYKNVNVLLKPLEFLTLASVSNVAGLISQVTIAANSTDYNYLEACLRVIVDGGDTNFLSSGTEDFFLSAYYFNKGIYHMDNSGLTSKTGKGQMSAFKFFENDPLLLGAATGSPYIVFICRLRCTASCYGKIYIYIPRYMSVSQ